VISIATESDDSLDLTAEPDVTGQPAPLPDTALFTLERQREHMRGRLGLILVILIVIYTLGITGLAAALARPFNNETISFLLAGVFTPVITVVGTVIGFYFGSVDRKQE
jgi:hypothetical protein